MDKIEVIEKECYREIAQGGYEYLRDYAINFFFCAVMFLFGVWFAFSVMKKKAMIAEKELKESEEELKEMEGHDNG